MRATVGKRPGWAEASTARWTHMCRSGVFGVIDD
jgi:hypothetical protein